MADRRAPSQASTRGPPVRRNLFNQHLSRRPTTTTSSTSTNTSSETLRLDQDVENPAPVNGNSFPQFPLQSQRQSSEIVRRDHNGDYELGDPSIAFGIGIARSMVEGRRGESADGELDEEDDLDGLDSGQLRGEEEAKERRRLIEAVKLHQRDRNRAPSEPAGELRMPMWNRICCTDVI